MTQRIKNSRIRKVFGAEFLRYRQDSKAYIQSLIASKNDPKKVFDVEVEVKPIMDKFTTKDIPKTLIPQKETVFEESNTFEENDIESDLSNDELLFEGVVYKKLPIQYPNRYEILNKHDLLIYIFIQDDYNTIRLYNYVRHNSWEVIAIKKPIFFYVRADLIKHLTIKQLN